MKLKLLQMIQIFIEWKITVGARRARVQTCTQKLADMLDSTVHARNTRAVGTSTHADACACAGVPQRRLFEFTSL